VVEVTNTEALALDCTRGDAWSFVMRGLTHSCRGMVLQRAARGVLACSSLDDDGDGPVRTKRGPTPLRRNNGAMSGLWNGYVYGVLEPSTFLNACFISSVMLSLF
jgi:hypothetical protein